MVHLLGNRYLVLAEVGRGGMGRVYKAQDTQLGDRLVAIKEIQQDVFSPEKFIYASKAFKQEAHMLAGLHHPSLPSIHDYFEEAKRWYLVMEFIQGDTLDKYSTARGGKLAVEEVLNIALQLCTVLDYLHTHQPPIIFRDLKPTNIMRNPDGHLYLIDFGIARHFKPGQTHDTAIFTSRGYAAPEQYGDAQTTARSDIYSLGATLHYLLSGVSPSLTPFRFAPLESQGQEKLARLNDLIMWMVELDESKRPATMAIVKQNLQNIASLNTRGSMNTWQTKISHSSPPPPHSSGVMPTIPAQQGAAISYAQPLHPQPFPGMTPTTGVPYRGSQLYAQPMIDTSYPYNYENRAGRGTREFSTNAIRSSKKGSLLFPRIMLLLAIACVAFNFVVPQTHSSSEPQLMLMDLSVGVVGAIGFVLWTIVWFWIVIRALRRKQLGWLLGILLIAVVVAPLYVIINPE